jgi:aconitate hydratase
MSILRHEVLENLMEMGALGPLIAGARLHQSGCMGCIGMGQAPHNTISLRTMPRNFPGRSGTLDDKIYLCSPKQRQQQHDGKNNRSRDLETLNISYPQWKEPAKIKIIKEMLIAPNGGTTELIKGQTSKLSLYLKNSRYAGSSIL